MDKNSFYIADNSLHVDYFQVQRCNSKSYLSHFHEDYELIFFIAVTGDYIVENRKYSLTPNDLLLIKPTKYHYLTPKNNSRYERVVINVAPGIIPEALLENAFNKGEFFRLSENATVVSNFIKLREYAQTFPRDEYLTLARALLTEILLLIAHIDTPEKSDEFKYLDEFNTRVIKYINQHLTSISSLEQLANDLFVSKSTLYHSFRRAMKISIMQYVRNKKVLLAQNLIRNGVRPTKACSLSGFDDYTTFYRSYKSFFGHSPNESDNLLHTRNTDAEPAD